MADQIIADGDESLLILSDDTGDTGLNTPVPVEPVDTQKPESLITFGDLENASPTQEEKADDFDLQVPEETSKKTPEETMEDILNGTIAKFEIRKESINTQLEHLNNEITDLKSQISNLEGQVGDKEKEIGTLKEEEQAILTNIKNLEEMKKSNKLAEPKKIIKKRN